MPVEIRELVIKAEFDDSREAPGDNDPSGASAAEHDELIQECVRQVLEILDRKQER